MIGYDDGSADVLLPLPPDILVLIAERVAAGAQPRDAVRFVACNKSVYALAWMGTGRRRFRLHVMKEHAKRNGKNFHALCAQYEPAALLDIITDLIHQAHQGKKTTTVYRQAMFCSASYGIADMVRNLLENPPQTLSKDSLEKAKVGAFLRASGHGQRDIVELLLDEYRVDIRADHGSATAWAAFHGHLEMIHLLLDRAGGVPASAQRSLALRRACEGAAHLRESRGKGRHLEVVRLLLERGANPCARCDKPLRAAVLYDTQNKTKDDRPRRDDVAHELMQFFASWASKSRGEEYTLSWLAYARDHGFTDVISDFISRWYRKCCASPYPFVSRHAARVLSSTLCANDVPVLHQLLELEL